MGAMGMVRASASASLGETRARRGRGRGTRARARATRERATTAREEAVEAVRGAAVTQVSDVGDGKDAPRVFAATGGRCLGPFLRSILSHGHTFLRTGGKIAADVAEYVP